MFVLNTFRLIESFHLRVTELVDNPIKIEIIEILVKIYTPVLDLSVPETGPVRVGVHVLNVVLVDGLHGMSLHLQSRGRALVVSCRILTYGAI